MFNYNSQNLLASENCCYHYLIVSENQLTWVVLLTLNHEIILTCFQPYLDWKDVGNTTPIKRLLSRMNKTHLYSSFLGKAVRGLIVNAH